MLERERERDEEAKKILTQAEAEIKTLTSENLY